MEDVPSCLVSIRRIDKFALVKRVALNGEEDGENFEQQKENEQFILIKK